MHDFASGAPLIFPAFFASRVSPAPQVMALATALGKDAPVSQHTYIPLLLCSFIFSHSYYMQFCVSCNAALEPVELHTCDRCEYRIHAFGKSSFVGCVITQRSDVDDDSRLLCQPCALIVNKQRNALAALSAVAHDGQHQQSALGNVGSTQV